MSTRPTTLVESDQLAQAAVNVIRNEALVPKGKRWLFSRMSKASRDYERAVQEITTRRRESRQNAVEQKLSEERAAADAIFGQAEGTAEQVHAARVAQARRPYDETEARVRSDRDAAVAAANLAYQQAMDEASRVYQQETATYDQERNALISDAKAIREGAYAALEAKRRSALAQIARDMKTIPLEGPMRIVEDREAWPAEERKKALIGIVDMAGRDDFEMEYADLCLRNVMGYVFQDRYLKPDAQQHRLMDVNLLEALVDLARRRPDKRPTVVKYMHDIVVQNPGHSSAAFIRALTELYVVASSDTETVYADNPADNEHIFDEMRAHIADTLKLTPRRSQVPPPPPTNGTSSREAVAACDYDDQLTPVMVRRADADITADVDIHDLLPVEPAETASPAAEVVEPSTPEASPPEVSEPADAPSPPPSPGRARSKRAPRQEDAT